MIHSTLKYLPTYLSFSGVIEKKYIYRRVGARAHHTNNKMHTAVNNKLKSKRNKFKKIEYLFRMSHRS